VKRAAITNQEKIMYLRARGLAYTVGIFLSAIALTAHSWAASRDLAHGMTEGPIAQMAMAEGSSAQNVPANKSRSDTGTTMKAASGDLRMAISALRNFMTSLKSRLRRSISGALSLR